MGCPLPSRLGSLGEHRRRKTSFGVFRAWENTPDFTSPDFSLTTLEFPDFSRFSRWVVTLSIIDWEADTILSARKLPVSAWPKRLRNIFIVSAAALSSVSRTQPSLLTACLSVCRWLSVSDWQFDWQQVCTSLYVMSSFELPPVLSAVYISLQNKYTAVTH